MNSLIQIKLRATLVIVLVVGCFATAPLARAVSPPPDGGYAGFNTAEGQNALFSLTTGIGNAAVGFVSLGSNTDGNYNTAVGAGALLANTADSNTAVGAGALLNNTTGFANTATGAFALNSNTDRTGNTAIGYNALMPNITGEFNTAVGYRSLEDHQANNGNTGVGSAALRHDISGVSNSAVGASALSSNTTGSSNTAIGYAAGFNQTTGDDNVYIGAAMQGIAGENNACYIKSIHGQVSAGGIPVLINGVSKLGTAPSSKRYKQDVKSMDSTSELLFALRPVTFRYKKDVDPAGILHFGLVAEEVETVNPDLIARDKDGKPYSVRYDQVNAMLLNEFLKEHRTVNELKATVAQQQKQLEALTAGLQKVSAQLELNKAAPQTVLNDN